MLSGRVAPSVRADTQFADMRAAYDALDEDTQASLEGLRVHHSIAYSRQVMGFDFSDAEKERIKGAEHPLVRDLIEHAFHHAPRPAFRRSQAPARDASHYYAGYSARGFMRGRSS